MIKITKLVIAAKQATEKRDREIVRLSLEDGMSSYAIARVSGMSRTAILHIINRENREEINNNGDK